MQPTDAPSQFFSTDWQLIHAASAEGVNGDRPQLGILLQRYMGALRNHLMRKWSLSNVDADDVLQSFIADKVLQAGLVNKANQQRGKFRTFLLTALDRFVISQHRKQQARPKQVHVEAEQISVQSGDDFTYQWALETVNVAIERLRTECQEKQRQDVWEVFYCQTTEEVMRLRGQYRVCSHSQLFRRWRTTVIRRHR